jgi:hypothetical protein
MKSIIFAVLMLIMVATIGDSNVSKAESINSALDAEIRTSDIRIPRTMKSGRKYSVIVKVKNTGDVKWTGRPFMLTSKIYRGPSGSPTQRDELTPIIDLKSDVNTGAYFSFHYDVEAPNFKGDYILEWTMKKGSSAFGDKTRKTVKVTD